jgi:hypothetical protein
VVILEFGGYAWYYIGQMRECVREEFRISNQWTRKRRPAGERREREDECECVIIF